jgi:hypothetical protein
MSEILYTFIVPSINLSISDSGNTPNISINNTGDLPNLSITQSGDTINVSIEQSGNPPNVNIYDYFLHAESHLKGGADQIDHNLLFGVQGGESGNYYHLNSGEYSNLVTGQIIRPSGTSFDFIKGDGSLDNTSYVKVEDLASSLTLYPTSATSDISGYYKLVTTPLDVNYDDPALNIPTGPITGSDQLIASLASESGLLVGDLGIFNITTIGNIKKTGGSTSSKATFHFEVHKRDSGGTEELIAMSSETLEVTEDFYVQFFAAAVFNDGVFDASDRVILKFYGTKIGGGSSPSYNFQFGGTTPVRVLLPVPVHVLLSDYLPYEGAIKDVDLGIYNLSAANIYSNGDLVATTGHLQSYVSGASGYLQAQISANPAYFETSINYTALSTDSTINCLSGLTLFLPTASGLAGKIYRVKTVATGAVIVTGFASETIDGETFQSLTQWDCMEIQSNGTSGWVII